LKIDFQSAITGFAVSIMLKIDFENPYCVGLLVGFHDLWESRGGRSNVPGYSPMMLLIVTVDED